MKKDTVILIPSYEPDNQLVPLVEKLLSLDFPIVLINDGSNEKYDEIFNQVKDKVVYLKHPKNKGKGAALKHGFSYLTFDNLDCNYVITCDGDGQHAVEDIVKVDEKMHKTNEIVFGVRLFGKDTPRHSKTGNNMSRFSRTLLTKEYIQDDQCGLRGFPFRYLDDLISTKGGRYEYEMNIVCELQQKRIPIYEVPIQTIYMNGNKGTHFNRGGDTFRIQRSIWFNAIYPLVNLLLTIGLFVIFEYIPLPEYWNDLNSMWFALVSSFFFQIALISILIPTKRMGKRIFIEGIFTLVRGIFVLLWSFLFLWLISEYELKINSVFVFIVAIFLSTFTNFFFAKFLHSIKWRKILKEYR